MPFYLFISNLKHVSLPSGNDINACSASQYDNPWLQGIIIKNIQMGFLQTDILTQQDNQDIDNAPPSNPQLCCNLKKTKWSYCLYQIVFQTLSGNNLTRFYSSISEIKRSKSDFIKTFAPLWKDSGVILRCCRDSHQSAFKIGFFFAVY